MLNKISINYIKEVLLGAVLGGVVTLLIIQTGNYLIPLPAFHNVDFLDRPDKANSEGVIISDTTGSLKELIVHFSIDSAKEILPAYKDLFRQIDPQTKVYIACPNEEDFNYLITELKDSGTNNIKRYQKLIMECSITPWARDRFLAKVPSRKNLKATLMLPPRPELGCEARLNDWFVPWKLASLYPQDYQTEKTNIYFHGGDIINAGNLMFIDYNLAVKNISISNNSIEEFKSAFGTKFGKRVILLGDENHPVPQHHIEMYITPIDEKTVLVADPKLAMDLLDKKRSDILSQIDLSEEVMTSFKNIITQLKQQGFTIVKIPLLPFKASRVYISYNNVILETRNGNHIVYMPIYHIQELDNYTRMIWERQGFEVRTINVSQMYQLGGAIRCLVNVLVRE